MKYQLLIFLCCFWSTLVTGQTAADYDRMVPKLVLPPPSAGSHLQISPDGKYLLTNAGESALIWDVHSGKLLHELPGHARYIWSLQFSPDGKQVWTQSERGVFRVWDVFSGDLLPASSAGQERITASQKERETVFSPDHKYVFHLNQEGLIEKMERSSAKIVNTFLIERNPVLTAQYEPESGQLILISAEGLLLWSNPLKQIIQKIPMPARSRNTMPLLRFKEDASQFLLLNESTLELRETKTGRLSYSVAIESHPYSKKVISKDAQFALILSGEAFTSAQAGVLTVLENNSGKTLFEKKEVQLASFNPDGSELLFYQKDAIHIVETQNWQTKAAIPVKNIKKISYSPKGNYIITEVSSSDQYGTKIWKVTDQQLIFQKASCTALVSPDEQLIFTYNIQNETGAIFKLQTGQLIHDKINNGLWFNYYNFSPDSKHLITMMKDVGVTIWDVFTGESSVLSGGNELGGEVMRVLYGGSRNYLGIIYDGGYFEWRDLERNTRVASMQEEASIYKVDVFEEQNLQVSVLYNGAVVFRRFDTGEELFKLYLLSDQDWAIIDPTGLFDASPGAMQKMHFTLGDEIIELSQLKDRYYEPGLSQKILGYTDERIRKVEGLQQLKLYPKVKAVIDGTSLKVELKERNGGIGPVRIYINGKEVEKNANPLPRGFGAKRDTTFDIDLSKYLKYFLKHPDSTNQVSIISYNEEGWLKSAPFNLSYKHQWKKAKGEGGSGQVWEARLDPKLYVVSIGTADYTGSKLDLRYADQDATSIALALETVGANLFANGDSLEVHCFSTANTDSTGLEASNIKWQFANKENIKNTFAKISNKAKAEDIIMVYLSGHGVTYGSAEQAQFHYLTQGMSNEDLSDVTLRNAYTITSEELSEWINQVPALKQVLIIDACNSGQIVENLTGGTKSMSTSQVRALDRMKDRTGMFILSGSASDKVSYEAGEYGQGLLTYALLQGMQGVATRKTADGEYIDIMQLFQHARDQVPRLAESINGIQVPMIGIPTQGASFDIGIFNEKVNIPVANKKPVIVRSTFLNQDSFLDDANLEEELEKAFRKETEKGKDADFIFVDVFEYPGSYAINGFYKMDQKGNISLKVKLFKDRKDPVELRIPNSGDPKRIVRYLLRELKKQLR